MPLFHHMLLGIIVVIGSAGANGCQPRGQPSRAEATRPIPNWPHAASIRLNAARLVLETWSKPR
jgi:hypothetical protein